MTVLVSDGSGQETSQQQAREARWWWYKAAWPASPQIAGSRSGLRGFLIAELGGEFGRWF
jgi:hypothetical protein